jgi:hypothetical protein
MDQRQAELYFLGAIYKSNGTDLFFKIKINYIQILVYITQVEIRGRFRQESTRNRWNVEAVLPPEIFPIFSNDLRPVPAEKHRKLTGIHRKKSNKFPVRVLLPLPPISGAFLQDPAGSSGRNLRLEILSFFFALLSILVLKLEEIVAL